MKRAVFLDKDGTLVENVPYNVDPARIELAEGALNALARLRETGFELVVVSNQSGVAHGYFPERALAGVERRLRELLGAIPIAGFYYCPHHPDGKVGGYSTACHCRKPAPGLLLRAAREHGVELAKSWLVGDILNDIEAGRRAGCRTVLLDNGNETVWELNDLRTPHFTATRLEEAAALIVHHSTRATETPAGGPPTV